MVSVIIPTFNRANTISMAIQSVLDQSFSDFELIIVDDCSTDNTQEIVKMFHDSRIRYIKLETNQGACVARNVGIYNAVGKYIAFQDSDDSWQTNKLDNQLDLIKKLNADICFCKIHRHGYPSNMAEYYPNLENGYVSYEKVLEKSIVSTQTILAKKSVFEEFEFNPLVKRMQDYDWIIRAGEFNKIVYTNDAVVDTFWQNDSITNSGYEVLLSTYEYFLKEYKTKFEKYPDFYYALIDKIAFNKTLLKKNAYEEYHVLYEKNKSIKTWIRWVLARTGLLKSLWRDKISS